jgi:hypothetical protein
MKNATKSILAALSLTLVLAACTNKQENASEVKDTVVTEPVQVDTTQAVTTDTTAAPADTTVAK